MSLQAFNSDVTCLCERNLRCRNRCSAPCIIAAKCLKPT